MAGSGDQLRWTTTRDLRLVEQSAAHQRWSLRETDEASGLIFEWLADVCHDDPVVRFWGTPIWSSRVDPRTYRPFKALLLRSGEFPALDFATRHGVSQPVRAADGWRVLLASDFQMKQGSGLPISGSLLTFVGPTLHAAIEKAQPNADGVMPPDVALDLSSLQAAVDGQICAVSHDWDGHWLAHEHAARYFDENQLRFDSQRALANFDGLMQVRADWYAERPLASASAQAPPATRRTSPLPGHVRDPGARAAAHPRLPVQRLCRRLPRLHALRERRAARHGEPPQLGDVGLDHPLAYRREPGPARPGPGAGADREPDRLRGL